MDKSRNYQSNVNINNNITNNETYESSNLITGDNNDNALNFDFNINIGSDNHNGKNNGTNAINNNSNSNINGSINDIIDEVKKSKVNPNGSVSKNSFNNNNAKLDNNVSAELNKKNREKIGDNEDKQNKVYSKVFPIRKAIPLFALTGGVYFYYWGYKNVKNIQEYHNIDMGPKLSTICLFIPILNIIILYDMFKKMENYMNKNGIESYSSVLMVITVILLPFSFFIFPLTIFLIFWPYFNVQESFNEYWLKKEPNLPVKRSFSDSELLTLIVGGFVFSIFGLLLFTFIASILDYPIFSI